MEHLLQYVFDLFEMPAVGLPAVFLSALISATLIPIGSEPILFGYVSLNPNLFWVAILVAALGNTAGGMIDWWLGLIARNTFDALKESKPAEDRRLKRWLIKRGPVMLICLVTNRR
ncbi:hypothetical protein SAMN06295945_1820 [Polynucleobacter meluiroseus]|uniref:Membrane protein YqaA, SNARE-associated domain n=1 Tax=Polynucleobacter meluiroseus TaxID=1938814 RepID=A0A240E2F4_9BURK|nr:hypothetical protein SAMN06295945_1820 [Polynucleobacter meluiroseus]